MLFHEGSNSFLEEVVDFDSAKYVVLPIPMEITTSYLKGTRFAPKSIIDASRSLENYNQELDYEIRGKVFTTNEIEIPPDTEKALETIKTTVSDVLASGKFPILIGGEHLLTYGASGAFDQDVLFVIFDAHADFKDAVYGVPLNHASDSRLVNGRNGVVLVGVRSLSLEEKKEIESRGLAILYMDQIRKQESKDSLARKISGRKVYISVDMDVFDPSIAPGVGTPQPNGLLYTDMIEYMFIIIKNSEIVGMDVTEVKPEPDNKATEVLAAKIITDVISLNEKKYE